MFHMLRFSLISAELGINFEHIWQKTLFVLLPRNGSSRQFIEDTDLAGPLLYCTLLGFSLLLVR